MGYIDTLDKDQVRNINYLIDAMKKAGIKNKYTQAAILAIISKESNFRPVRENMNYSAQRIMQVWPNTSYSEAQKLAHNPVGLANAKYGGRYGNGPNEGYKYRGGGYNQLTFKGNYRAVGKQIGRDLENHPELIEDPKIAAEAAVNYFVQKFKSGYKSRHAAAYNSPDIDSFKSVPDSTLAVFHANAGFGRPTYSQSTVTGTGGLQKALKRAPDLYKYVLKRDEKKN